MEYPWLQPRLILWYKLYRLYRSHERTPNYRAPSKKDQTRDVGHYLANHCYFGQAFLSHLVLGLTRSHRHSIDRNVSPGLLSSAFIDRSKTFGQVGCVMLSRLGPTEVNHTTSDNRGLFDRLIFRGCECMGEGGSENADRHLTKGLNEDKCTITGPRSP